MPHGSPSSEQCNLLKLEHGWLRSVCLRIGSPDIRLTNIVLADIEVLGN